MSEPDSTPTPVTSGWPQLRAQAAALAERLEARSAYHSRVAFDVQSAVRCRWAADRLREWARGDDETVETYRALMSGGSQLLDA